MELMFMAKRSCPESQRIVLGLAEVVGKAGIHCWHFDADECPERHVELGVSKLPAAAVMDGADVIEVIQGNRFYDRLPAIMRAHRKDAEPDPNPVKVAKLNWTGDKFRHVAVTDIGIFVITPCSTPCAEDTYLVRRDGTHISGTKQPTLEAARAEAQAYFCRLVRQYAYV